MIAWIVGMQAAGLPLTREMVLAKANEASRTLYIRSRSSGFLDEGWLKRVLGHQFHLSLLNSQVISRARNQVSDEAISNSLSVQFCPDV